MGDVIPGDSRKVRGLLNAAAQYHDGVGCRSFPPYLDLHFFDNTEFDCHPPKKWMELGQVTVNTAHGKPRELSQRMLIFVVGSEITELQICSFLCAVLFKVK